MTDWRIQRFETIGQSGVEATLYSFRAKSERPIGEKGRHPACIEDWGNRQDARATSILWVLRDFPLPCSEIVRHLENHVASFRFYFNLDISQVRRR